MSVPLSICIPSYKRRQLVFDLVRKILSTAGDFEVIVHLDGDADRSAEALSTINDSRLKVSSAPNAGRAHAIAQALSVARGKYIMIYDDDDTLSKDGLRTILDDCSIPLPNGICGFIYHMSDMSGEQLGSSFRADQSNFVKLRADENVTADKKEVVLREVVNRCNEFDISSHRRVPTSLLWATIALEYDVLCRDVIVGKKNYDGQGMSANIKKLKRIDPFPIFETHRLRLLAWHRRRYKSWRYAGRSALAALYFGFLCVGRRR